MTERGLAPRMTAPYALSLALVVACGQTLKRSAAERPVPSPVIAPLIENKSRALTVPLSRFQGTASRVRGGDFADLLLTFNDPSNGELSTITLIQRAPVLAATQSDLTFLLLPEEAERVAFGLASGALVLTQRRPDDIEPQAARYHTTLKTMTTGERTRFDPPRIWRDPGVLILPGGRDADQRLDAGAGRY
jgi:Flp pilus assembly protein CpaB